MSYQVVKEFEAALSEYTGAPYVVTTNSCSMALTLALAYSRHPSPFASAVFPSRTYASAPMAAIHAGCDVLFDKRKWDGEYNIYSTPVWDSARRFTSGMYREGQFQCVSFQTSKILGLEQGGAILHDDPEADTWFRRARFDGRLDASEKLPQQIGWHCYMNPSTAALGLQHLACLPKDNPDNGGSYLFDDLSQLDIWK
jgi:dTDP-4-amino-4,6-dideoxygalactose transaminase